MQTALAGMGAGVLVNPTLVSASSQSENQYERVYANSDVRLKAMTMERIDTHCHYDLTMSELKGEDESERIPTIEGKLDRFIHYGQMVSSFGQYGRMGVGGWRGNGTGDWEAEGMKGQV